MNYKRCPGFIVTGIVLLIILVFCSINVYSSASLEPDKAIVSPGEEIAVYFSVSGKRES